MIDAKTGSYLGDRAKLPLLDLGHGRWCQRKRRVYEVALRYFDDDHNPSGQSDAWRASNALPCPLTSASTQPYFALIEATGSTGAVASNGAAGDRRLSAIYRHRLERAHPRRSHLHIRRRQVLPGGVGRAARLGRAGDAHHDQVHSRRPVHAHRRA